MRANGRGVRLSLLMLVLAVWAGRAAAEAPLHAPLAVRTLVELPARLESLAKIEMLGLGSRTDGSPDVLHVTWVQEGGGFFATWYIVIESEQGLLTGQNGSGRLRIGPAAPSAGHTYRTAVSYDAEAALLSLAVYDETDQRRVYADAYAVAAYDGPFYVIGTQPVEAHNVYIPLELNWDVGRMVDGRFVTSRSFEPGETTVVRVTTKSRGSGVFRVTTAGAEAVILGTAAAAAGETLIELPPHTLPLGSGDIALEYVDGETVHLRETRRVNVGKLGVTFDAWNADDRRGVLTSALTVETESDLTGVTVAINVGLRAITWQTDWSSYTETPVSTETYTVWDGSATFTKGKTRVPISVPLPAEPGYWSVAASLSVTPDVTLQVSGESRVTFATGGYAPAPYIAARRELPDGAAKRVRVCTYNILGFQGYPETEAERVLGSRRSAERFEHFVNVIASLDCDILAVQEAWEAGYLARVADRLGYNLSLQPSSWEFLQGAVFSRYPILETRYFNQVEVASRQKPWSRFLGAALVDVSGTPVWVVHLHGHPDQVALREGEAAVLAEVIPGLLEVTPYAVVLGDYNSRPGEPIHAALERHGFANALTLAGKVGLPVVDHIYVSAPLHEAVLDGWEVSVPAYYLTGLRGIGIFQHSDHRPVVAELAWR